MSDTVTMSRGDLEQFINNTAERAINETLRELGIKRKMLSPWISKAEAGKLIGRGRLDRAIRRNQVAVDGDLSKRTHNIKVLKKDIQKLLNNPIL